MLVIDDDVLLPSVMGGPGVSCSLPPLSVGLGPAVTVAFWVACARGKQACSLAQPLLF
jgi:hypothetical protein